MCRAQHSHVAGDYSLCGRLQHIGKYKVQPLYHFCILVQVIMWTEFVLSYPT